jgi:Fuc2NAc and GlcNAc transferase
MERSLLIEHALVGLATFVLAVVLTALARKLALAAGLLDVPNQRSSHHVSTARGGGVAIVIACLAGLAFLAARSRIDNDLLWALAVGGAAVAAIGFADDRYQLSALARLTVHFIAAIWAVSWLGGLAPLDVGGRLVDLGWIGDVAAVLALVWATNAFNFMDGIDGLAAGEATFVAVASVVLGSLAASAPGAGAALIFAAACAGFLVWNWPPAKIFMGDVGSGFLGFAIGVLAIAATRHQPAAPFVWLILAGTFFVDSGVTLGRRIQRGARIYQAHRTHAYQWLARGWRSHTRVTLAFMAVNVCWLLPCAFFAVRFPALAVWLTAAALVPLAILAVAAGAGRPETPREMNAESGDAAR